MYILYLVLMFAISLATASAPIGFDTGHCISASATDLFLYPLTLIYLSATDLQAFYKMQPYHSPRMAMLNACLC